MSEIIPFPSTGDIAPSVRKLLALFNEDTAHKLSLAPMNSRPKLHLADGTFCELDTDGFPDPTDVRKRPLSDGTDRIEPWDIK